LFDLNDLKRIERGADISDTFFYFIAYFEEPFDFLDSILYRLRDDFYLFDI
jgi:hypothetical protein